MSLPSFSPKMLNIRTSNTKKIVKQPSKSPRKKNMRGTKVPLNTEMISIMHYIMETMKKTKYVDQEKSQIWNEKTGVYETDCSSLIERMIEKIYSPNIIAEIKLKYAGKKSLSRFYAKNFYKLATLKDFPYGREITDITKVLPGDLWIIEYPTSKKATGHVMMVRWKPKEVYGSSIKKKYYDVLRKVTKVKKIYTIKYNMGIFHASSRTGFKGINTGKVTFILNVGSNKIKKVKYMKGTIKGKYNSAYKNKFLRLYKFN